METNMTFNSQLGRITFVALTSVAALGAMQSQALAQSNWPNRPVTLVVPFPPGGTTDVLARTLAERLSGKLGQPVIVENRPGAGATIGAEYVAKGPADGHVLLIGAVHHTIAPSVYKRLGYDFQKDFQPITTLAMVPNVLVINAAKTPVDNVAQLVGYVQKNPNQATYGSNGNGTAQHMIGTEFQAMTGTTLIHVPYKGSGPLATDLLGGQILMSFDTLTPVLPHIQAGKLKALAVTTAERSKALPDVPTLAESGLPGFNIGTWFGVLAPAATPNEVVGRLSRDMVEIIKSPDFVKRMDEIGAQPVGNTREEMKQQIAEETAKFAELVKKGKITID